MVRRLGPIALVVLFVVLAVVYHMRTASTEVHHIRIATGGTGGTYLPLGRGLAEAFNKSLPGEVEAEALETAGSGDNVGRLARGEAELAIVQNDTEVGPDVRAIAPLYPEVLHVVVRAGAHIERLRDLAGHPTSAGPEGSGTDLLAQRVLAHFDLQDIGKQLVHCSTTESVERFEAGTLDATFIVSGLKSSAVSRLLEGQGRLLSLGDPAQVGSALDGLRVSEPFLLRTVIPARAYGEQPPVPIGTVAVQAVLVTRADMDSRLVYKLTAAMFANRVALMKAHRAAANLSEQFDPSQLQAPLHPGADQYYRRDTPPAYVQYADFLDLLLTVAVGLASAVLAGSRWMTQTKKDRIDVYYLDIREVTRAWVEGEVTAREAREKLEALRSRAFDELVAERLSANQSFTIFQDYITSELTRVERAIVREGRG